MRGKPVVSGQRAVESKARKPERICCLTGSERWEAPADGEACKSRRHGHMHRSNVERLIAENRMEWVAGCRIGAGAAKEETVWIPVAKFVAARRWRKTISYDGRAAVAVMQLVSGG